jgi:nicotinamide mononucleotide transporter
MTAFTEWLASTAFVSFGAPTSWVEVIGFATGALCVLLVARQSVWNWPIGIANNVAFVLLFVGAGLYADSALQIVYIALDDWGWITWTSGGHRKTTIVTATSVREWTWLAIAGVAGVAGITMLLSTATESVVPFWDALTTTLSLLATWGQINKRRESWFLWIAADVIYVPLYLYKDLVLTAVLYLGFIALCVGGLLAWTASMRDAELVEA